jgi:putative solute:sodium symporter small subunit
MGGTGASITMPAMSNPAGQRLWHQTRQLTAALLLLWLVVCLAGAWFARGLNGLSMFGFPLGFWVAAQGALLAFLLIIVVYVVCMERLEARYQREMQASTDTPPEGGPVPQ